MEERNRKRNTWLFMAFLLLGGVIHFLDRKDYAFVPDTLIFCVIFTIYAGLIIFWMQTVRDRLIRSRSRSYTLAAGWMMLLYLLIRTLKYRIDMTPAVSRAFWYLFYVPMIMMPMLFLMTCIRFHSGRDSRPGELALLIPAVLLTGAVLTNDMHFLVFYPKTEPSLLSGVNGTYGYGPLYWAVYAWIGLSIALGVFFLWWKAHGSRGWQRVLWPIFFLAAIPAVVYLNDTIGARGYHKFYQVPETHIFCMLGVFEACIRSRLMPRNENYAAFFTGMEIPAMIADAALSPVYRTAKPLEASPDQLRAALRGPLALDADIQLFGRAIHGGCAFWTVDESTLHRLNDRLEEANETIGLENELIRYENEQREEKARLDARNAVYAKA